MSRSWASAVLTVLIVAGWGAAQGPDTVAPNGAGTPISALAGGVVVGGPDPALTPPPTPSAEAVDLWGRPVPTAPDMTDASPPPYRVWFDADFLAWRLTNAPLPALTSIVPIGVIQYSTTNQFISSSGATLSQQQILNFASVNLDTSPSFAGGNPLNAGTQLGARFTAGVWLDPQESLGLESSFFFINSRLVPFRDTTGNNITQFPLTFPNSSNIYTLTTTTTATSTTTTSTLLQSLPTVAVRQSTSNISGSSSSALLGGEVNARSVFGLQYARDPFLGYLVSGLLGFRYVDFHESLQVGDAVGLFLPPGFQDVNGFGQPLNTNLPTNLNYTTLDSIRTTNQFFGGQGGLDVNWYAGRFLVDLRGKVGLGVMHETVDVFGATQTNGVVVPGGLLSSPLDQGTHTFNRIAVVPEINVKLGYQLRSWVRVFAGYDFLYLSSVVRPGDQTAISSTNIQATVSGTTTTILLNQPSFQFHPTDLVVNGINCGVEFRY